MQENKLKPKILENTKSGITLIALVITIIVLLILAGVALATLTGQGNIIGNVENAVGKYNNSVEEEQQLLNEIEKYLINQTNKNDSENDEDFWQEPLEKVSEWNGTVQTPHIMKGMTPVYWSTDGGKTASTTQEGAQEIYARIDSKGNACSTGIDNPNFKWENWYAYIAGDNSTDTKTSRWANAVTDDGSYWVWIPRFKYKITDIPEEDGISNAGKVDVKFISVNEKSGVTINNTTYKTNKEDYKIEEELISVDFVTTDTNDYILHPVFEDGSNTSDKAKNQIDYIEYNNGEWDSELAGFWMAKYKMSIQEYEEFGTGGNLPISDSLSMVSKPNMSTWMVISLGQAYQNCLNYDSDKNSHLTKNSEWGAVTYLAHSQYGRNRNEVSVNASNGEDGMASKTGFSAGIPAMDNIYQYENYSYDTEEGMLASTTGNIYGIYDMSTTNAIEYTSGYQKYSMTLAEAGKAIDGTIYFDNDGGSNRFKTEYICESFYTGIYHVSELKKKGDGVSETKIIYKLWFDDNNGLWQMDNPINGFIVRGGVNSGIFSVEYIERFWEL